MDVPLEVDPAELRRLAEVHAQAADTIKAARADKEQMNSDAQTLGPLYHQVRAAVSEATSKRDQALAFQQQRHEQMSEALLVSAAQYERVEAENRAHLTISPTDR